MLNIKKYLYSFVQSFTIMDSNMETGLTTRIRLAPGRITNNGSDLEQQGSE